MIVTLWRAVACALFVLHVLLKWHEAPMADLYGQGLNVFSSVLSQGSHVDGHTLLAMHLTEGADKSTTLQTQVAAHPYTVVAFFEAWCQPCRHELPGLQQHEAAWRARGVHVMGIYGDSEPNAISLLQQQLGLTFAVWRDGGKTAARAGITAVPTTVVFNRAGEVLRETRGIDVGLDSFIVALPATGVDHT